LPFVLSSTPYKSNVDTMPVWKVIPVVGF
jgi:hypothetical protein